MINIRNIKQFGFMQWKNRVIFPQKLLEIGLFEF
jgi:hypothetical protein